MAATAPPRPAAYPRAPPGPAASGRNGPVDRRLANRNLRTGFIAGALALIVFAASFAVGFVY